MALAFGFAAGVTPDVAVVDVVVVGEADAGDRAGELAPGPAEKEPFAEIVEAGGGGGEALDAVVGVCG